MKVGVIRNPKSARGKGGRSWEPVEARLRSALGPNLARIEQTTHPGSGAAQAEQMARGGIDLIVAAGGDGTISDVMQGVLQAGATLAILPMGTGNDFARTLELNTVDRAIAAIKGGETKLIDVGSWKQSDRQGHFLNVAGCGFDACVADRVNTGNRLLHGQLAYLAGIVQTLISYEPVALSLVIDGEPLESRATLCAIANAKCYGGGIQVAPTADVTDGLLDLVLVGHLTKVQFLRSFPRVLNGTHLTHPKVTHRRFKSLQLHSEPASLILVDGELLPAGDVTFQVVPSALRVIVPTTQMGRAIASDR